MKSYVEICSFRTMAYLLYERAWAELRTLPSMLGYGYVRVRIIWYFQIKVIWTNDNWKQCSFGQMSIWANFYLERSLRLTSI